MSLLSSIRYPISAPPTRAQLEALPHEVFMGWLEEIGMKNSPTTPSAAIMAEYLDRAWANENLRLAVARLQCIVYGLDE